MEISKRAKIQSDKPLYKEKKKTDKGYVWVYDEKTIQKRWKEKKDKIKKLQSGIEKLRKKYEKDLGSDDLRTQALAAVVAIMDETAMRIGNEDSAKDAKTYGASTLKVKHLTFSGNKAKIKYVGKGGVDQETEVTGKKLISVLKELTKGKKDNDFVFEIDGTKIWDRAVNRYLNPFNISAKDLRGFHSNRLMKEQLKTKDWKEALDEVAELVGHKPSTLKNQYLDPELVEKYENKKEAGISIRADQLTTTPMSQTVEQIGQPIMSDPELYAKQTIDINRNVPNISDTVKMTPVLQQAWRIIAPFLPPGSKLTSGFRDDYDQIKIILENWLSWTPSGDYKKNQGFFHKNDPKSKGMEGYLRNLLYRAKQGLHGQEVKFSPKELKFIESLRQKMTNAEGEERLDIAPVGESWHLMGSALDIVGNFGKIAKAIQYLQQNYSHILPIRFHKYEPGNKAYHVEIGGQITMPSAEDFSEMLYAYQSGPKLNLTKRQSLLISKRALLKPEHAKEIEQMRQKQVSPSSISKRDTNFGEQLSGLKIKVPANKLNKEILSTWYELQKLNVLPESAWMTSAIRTPEDQVRVIHNYWQSSGLNYINPEVRDPRQMAEILRSRGYSINNPESTPHSSGRSFDISGGDLNEIADAVMEASRQTGIKMRTLVEENNNSVHVDILGQQATASVVVEEDDDMAEDEIDMNSIYEDLMASNAPEEVLEAFKPEEQNAAGQPLAEEWTDLADDEPNKYEREKDDPKWKKPLLKDWTREEIRNHYAKNADKILKEIKGEPVMLYIGTDKNKNILKRKHNDKPIVMDNKEDLLYWADRRLLSIHRVFGPKTKLGFVDLDVHGDFPKEKAKEYAKDIAAKIKVKYSTTPTIFESGGSGYHIEFTLKQEKDIDSLRDELHDMCEELNKDYGGFTTGIVKGSGVRTDTTTLKNNGNIRVPYAIHESKGGVKQPIGGEKKASISIRADEMLAEVEVEKPQVKLPEEQKGDIGFGKDDQMGDWFEKSLKFLERKKPDIDLHDIDESAAGQLANSEPDTFFYRGLHKTYPKLESDALKNMLKDNAKFYFVFKYHERPEEPFKALLQPAAEALSQQDVRAFFYYHLHHNFPELGRGAIIQLVDTNPDSFFDLGCDKDYPDYIESANNARNIKDPNKVELELDQLEQITSSMKISKRASKKKLAAEAPDIQITDKEKQIFDILLGAIRHFRLSSTIRVAGGWVRDKVMGKNSKDIDIAVDNMSGKDFAEKALAYARMQGVPAKSVGVIEARPDQSKHLETAVVNLLDESIDFVNLRAEKYDPNTRIPQVVPGTALEDAYRRDFTINALFYNINEGKVEDLTGTGVEDIKNGVIRTPIPPKEIWSQVGITDESQVINPKKTFMDDPLRILRAIRFASRYGFKLAPELMEAARDPEVQESFRSKISRERIEAELRKMIAGPSPVWALQLIKELGLRSEVLKLPEGTKEWEMDQNNPHHQLNIWDHISETLGNLQQIIKDRNLNESDKFAVNLAAFLHDVGKLDPKIHGTKEIEGKIVSTYHGHEESSIAIAEYMLKNLPGVRTEEIERIKKLIDAARRVNPTRQESSEIATMTRKQLGNFVRMIGDDWENAIDIAMADASAKKKDWLPTYNPTYYKSLKEQIKGMGLEKAHTMKPLLTGDELMKLFGRKGGKWVGVLNKELIQWQLENPTATKDDAIASAKQLYQQMDLAKSADFLISKRAVEPTMEFKKQYDSEELPPFDPSKYEGSSDFQVQYIGSGEEEEAEELPPELIVRPSLTEAEAIEQIKKNPIVFMSYSGFSQKFPHLERMAIEEIAKRFPEVYFISKFQDNQKYQDLNEMALDNLLLSRPTLYFTMGLFSNEKFANKLGDAARSVAEKDPQFFLGTLLPLERFKDFRSLEGVAREALKKSRAFISKRAKPKKHAKAGIFAVVPGDLAKGFPSLGDHDDSKPHVTVLFIGEVPKKHEDLLEETVKDIVSGYEPFEVKLDEKISYFPASKHSDGCKIAKLKVISKDLHKFHDTLKEGISNAGIEIDDHFPDYKPHVTLEYMEPGKEAYDGDAPNGSWKIESVEIWNGDYRKRFRLGGNSISKRAKLLNVLYKVARTPKDLDDVKKYAEDFPYDFFMEGFASDNDFKTFVPIAAQSLLNKDPLQFISLGLFKNPELDTYTRKALRIISDGAKQNDKDCIRIIIGFLKEGRGYSGAERFWDSIPVRAILQSNPNFIYDLSKHKLLEERSVSGRYKNIIKDAVQSLLDIDDKPHWFWTTNIINIFPSVGQNINYIKKAIRGLTPEYFPLINMNLLSDEVKELLNEYKQYIISEQQKEDSNAEFINVNGRLVKRFESPGRPDWAKKEAEKLAKQGIDTFVHIQPIYNYRDIETAAQKIKNVKNTIGEISVSTLDKSPALFTKAGKSAPNIVIGAMFKGKLSHYFPRDSNSFFDEKLGLRRLRPSNHKLSVPEHELRKSDPMVTDEGWINPAKDENKITMVFVMSQLPQNLDSDAMEKFDQLREAANRAGAVLAAQNGLTLVNFTSQADMIDALKNLGQEKSLDEEAKEQAKVEKMQQPLGRYNIPQGFDVGEYVDDKTASISKRAGELIHIKGMPPDLVEKLNQLPSDDAEPNANSNFYRASGNIYIKGPDLEHNITVGWRFVNYYALPQEFRDMAAAHVGYGARVFVAYGPDAHDIVFKHDSRDAEDVYNRLKNFLTGPELDKIKERATELAKKDTNVVELPKKGSISIRAKDKLKEYKKKREFDKTPEPEGKISKRDTKKFVIHNHHATKHHWDLRLEHDGVLQSWALPKHKLPSAGEKQLAVKTEAHPMSYMKFEGDIPEGSYGAGESLIHDSGKYELIKWEKDTIKFKLNGKKEKGAYTLHKTDGKNWMIMRMKEE